jgi:pSer/pThr/pTyr-binding forkhead associated (FHA) protein
MAVDFGGSVTVAWRDKHGEHRRSFNAPFVIGRDPNCEIVIDDPMVSRRHASVTYEEMHWFIEDLGSRNGTLLDGHAVKREPLPDGSEIKLHKDGPVLNVGVSPPSPTTHRYSPQDEPV